MKQQTAKKLVSELINTWQAVLTATSDGTTEQSEIKELLTAYRQYEEQVKKLVGTDFNDIMTEVYFG